MRGVNIQTGKNPSIDAEQVFEAYRGMIKYCDASKKASLIQDLLIKAINGNDHLLYFLLTEAHIRAEQTVTLVDGTQQRLLISVIQRGNAVATQLLLAAGACPNKTEGDPDAPVIIAARMGYRHCLDRLKTKKADLSAVDNKGHGIAYHLARRNDAVMIAVLVGDIPQRCLTADYNAACQRLVDSTTKQMANILILEGGLPPESHSTLRLVNQLRLKPRKDKHASTQTPNIFASSGVTTDTESQTSRTSGKDKPSDGHPDKPVHTPTKP